MNSDYQQALATMPAEDISFILSLLPTKTTSVMREVSSGDAGADVTQPDEEEEARRRRHIEREWPELATRLTAEYYGVTYTAQVVPARKRLKSNRQIVILDGPAQGALCDSFSEAMLAATEEQRTSQNLGRKGVSNGWVFWQWPGKPENTDGDGEKDFGG